MKKIIVFVALVMSVMVSEACTSAIVSGKMARDGRPLLWKHRDTGEENNKVERIPAEGQYMEYIALYNASDKDCREAWMGFNVAGFAIMNTASYNIKDDTIKIADREGEVMSKALKICKTVADFKTLLDTIAKPIGVEANFGVIDAAGNGGYFETNNYKYTFYDLEAAENGILTRTNYSYSGREDKGFGYIREINEKEELAPYIANKSLCPEVFTEVLSRTFYHSLLGKDYTQSGEHWVVDQDFIPRRISTATTVIEGVRQNEDSRLTTMWIGIGYPPCSEIRCVWIGNNGLPDELRGIGRKGHSPLCDTVVARKREVFPIERGNGKDYIDFTKLYNKEETGYCQILKNKNEQAYRQGYLMLEKRRKELMKKKRK